MTTEFLAAVPIIPARKIDATAEWYLENLGFEVHHTEPEYGIVARDETSIHFWGPSGIRPEDSMSMIRVRVRGIDELYADCDRVGIVHPAGRLETKPWGSQEFAVRDLDGNLVTFFEAVSPDGDAA